MNVNVFRAILVKRVYANMRHAHVGDNYDLWRFPLGEDNKPVQVDYNRCAEYFSFLMANIGSFHTAYLLLADERSRKLFFRLMLYRSLGYEHFAIDPNRTWTTEAAILKKAESYSKGVSELALTGGHGSMWHHESIPAAQGVISLDCWAGNVAYTAIKRQYYFQRNKVVIQPEEGDWVVDAGACFGDTAVYFAKSVGDRGKVFSFDPLPAHGQVVLHNVRQNSLDGVVTFIPSAVGAGSNGIDPNSVDALPDRANPGFSLRKGPAGFPVVSIDDVMAASADNRVDFIKMDIEGLELDALKGAENSIRKWKPKLAISLYHKKEDFFEIPIWIASKFPDYDLYLDHYSIHAEETVLYARARSV